MTIDAKVPRNLQDTRDFINWSVRFYDHAKDVEKEFKKALADDGKVDAQEATKIRKELIDLITGLALLLADTTESDEINLDPFTIETNGQEVQIRFSGSDLPEVPVQKEKFLPFFQELITKEVRSFFNKVLEILADDTVTTDEAEIIRQNILPIMKKIASAIAEFHALTKHEA